MQYYLKHLLWIFALFAVILLQPTYGQADQIISDVVAQFDSTSSQGAEMVKIKTTNARGGGNSKVYRMCYAVGKDVKITLRRKSRDEGLVSQVSADGSFRKSRYWDPSLSQPTRINLSNQDQGFSGTAFSYEDIKLHVLLREDTTRFEYTLQAETDTTWHIKAEPESGTESQYDYRLLVVRKSDKAVVEMRGFVRDELRRKIVFSEFRTNAFGTSQPQRITAEYLRAGRAVITSTVNLDYTPECLINNPYSIE